jgi:hypothetical protein
LCAAASVALAGAACGEGEAPKEEEAAASFNYVPLNINVCKVKDDNASRLKVAKKLSALGRMDSVVAQNLQLCADCPDNMFGWLLKDTAAAISIGGKKIGGKAGALNDHVNKALSYPFRHLVLSHGVNSGSTNLVLSQAIRVGNPRSPQYQVQTESLASDCNNYDLIAPAKVTDLAADCGDAVKTSIPMSKAFGFKVPSALPPSTASQEEAAAFLERTAALGILVEKPEVQYTVNDKGEGEGMLSGWVDPGSLKPFTAGKINLAKYVDDKTKKIRLILQFKTKRAALTTAVSADVARMTKVLPPVVKGPPALTTGTTTWTGGSCTNCKALAKQMVCGDDPASESPLTAVHISGDSGSFKIKFDGEGERPHVDTFALENGGVLQADGDANLNEVQFTYTRGFRPGAGMQARPACAAVLAGTQPVPATFDPKDGWARVGFRSTDGVEVGCQRTLLICQEFDNSVCGTNGKLLDNGTCGCLDGYTSAFDACVKPEDYGCDPAAILGKDATGAVTCACPATMAGDGKKCVTDPCKNNGTCKDGEHCLVQADGTAGCEPEAGTAMPDSAVATRPSAVNAAFEAAAAAPPGEPGFGTKYGAAADDDDDDDDDESGYGDDDDAAAASPPGAPGVDFIREYGRSTKRSFVMASDLILYPLKGKLPLPEDLERYIGKKKVTAGAIVTKLTSKVFGSGRIGALTMYVSAANHGKISAALKAKNLTHALRIGTQTWSYDPRTADWFPAKEGIPAQWQMSSIHVAPCPDVVHLTNNKTELVYQVSVMLKSPGSPKAAKPQVMAKTKHSHCYVHNGKKVCQTRVTRK